MALFAYTAMDVAGRRKKGMVEADSEKHTRQLLREQKLTPVSVKESAHKQARFKPFSGNISHQAISQRELSIITRQFATMIKAGLPVAQALQALGRQNENPVVKSIISSVRAKILEGNSLAESLNAYPRIFSELYRTGIHAGERTGHLSRVMEYLADFTESSYQARQKMLLALLYPAILTIVSLMIILFLLTYIVPDMIKVFNGAGQDLPLVTRALIATSDAVQHYGLVIILAVFAFIIAIRKALQSTGVKLALDKKLLLVPILGKLTLQYASARFSSTLGMLHESGVPLVQALEISTAMLSNRHLRSHMRSVSTLVNEGVSLSQAMEKTGVMPPVLVTMAGSGEASGQLGEMLRSASEIQQRDLETHIAILLGLFEPMVLLLMGGIVLLIVLAIILPILHLNQLVK